MPFPFGKSHKSPADIVKNLKDSMTVLEKHDISDKKAEKVGERCDLHHLLNVNGETSSGVCLIQATEEVSKSLVAMKEILYGTNEKEPQTEAVAQLAQELYNSGLLSTLIADLQLIDFEVRLSTFGISRRKAMCMNICALSVTSRERKMSLRSSTTSSGARLAPGRPQWSTCAPSRISSSCYSKGKIIFIEH